MRAFTAAEADVSSKDNFAGEEECQAAAESLMEIREIQIAASDGDFAGIVERENSNGADDAAIVFRLNQKRVGTTETEVTEGAERGLIVDVAAADGLLQIKRNGVGGAGVRHGEANANVQNAIGTADAVLRFGVDRMAKVRDKAAERIVAGVVIVKIPVAKTVVELNVLGSKGKMRAKKRFDMEERGL